MTPTPRNLSAIPRLAVESTRHRCTLTLEKSATHVADAFQWLRERSLALNGQCHPTQNLPPNQPARIVARMTLDIVDRPFHIESSPGNFSGNLPDRERGNSRGVSVETNCRKEIGGNSLANVSEKKTLNRQSGGSFSGLVLIRQMDSQKGLRIRPNAICTRS